MIGMLAVVPEKPIGAEVVQLESIADLADFLAVQKAVQPRHVARCSFRRGAQPCDESAIVGHGDFIDPPLPGDVLADDFAVAIKLHEIGIALRRDRADDNRSAIVAHIEASNPLPRQRPKPAGIPARHIAARHRRTDLDQRVGRMRLRCSGGE